MWKHWSKKIKSKKIPHQSVHFFSKNEPSFSIDNKILTVKKEGFMKLKDTFFSCIS